MRDLWRIHPADSPQAVRLAESLRIHPITAQLLLNRGMNTAIQGSLFLHPRFSSLSDPFLLAGIASATECLVRAIQDRQRIVIFSDSDTDGLTASVILYEALEELGAKVSAIASNRIADGYGFPSRLAADLRKTHPAVLMLVDCGTNQPDVVRQLSLSGMDVIIVDHHLPLDGKAAPYALINPHCTTSEHGREFCSAGLAFKLSQALFQRFAKSAQALESYADLAALGTLADCSPIRGDNRIFLAEGLRRIVENKRPGLGRLCQQTGVKTADADSVIRRLIPRLNASGRLGDAHAVWQLLRRSPEDEIEKWLKAAEEAYATTKQLRKEMIAQAYAQVNRLHFKDQYVMVVSRAGWHQGLMGPLASQLSQQYGRPAIAIAVDEEQATGSGRSIPSINLLEVLKRCQELLLRFGGHAYACGLTLNRRHIDRFRELVNAQAKASFGQAAVKECWADLDLPLNDIHSDWVAEAEHLSPFGEGNPEPLILIRKAAIRLQSPRVGVVDDGTLPMTARGVFPPLQADERYDLLASPRLLKQQLFLAVAGVKPSAGL